MKNQILAGLLGLAPLVVCVAAPRPGDADFPSPKPCARHDAKVKAVRSGDYDLVLIGDSITQTVGDLMNGRYDPSVATWKRHYAPRHAINLGYSGYRTQEILWNLRNGELDFKKSPKVFMVLIGTNNADDRHFPTVNTPEQILAGTKAIVETIRARHPDSKILLLRIFPRGGDDQKSAVSWSFASSKASIETARRAGELTRSLADGSHVFWSDINHVFLNPDGTIDTRLMWDLLHPSPAGIEAWTQAVEPTLARLMGDKPIMDAIPAPVSPVPRTDGSYDWMKRHEAVLAAHATNPAIVFIGDSITHHMGGTPAPTGPFLSHRGETFWTDITAKAGPGLNCGFGADKTQHVLWRIDHGELDGIRPRRVVLMIGTNNILQGGDAASTAAGVRACLLRIRAKLPEAKIVLMGVLPCRNPASKPVRAVVKETNLRLAQLAKEAKCDFIDLGASFLDAKGDIPADLMDDAIHPTPAGYAIWEKALAPLLSEEAVK